MKSTDTGKGTYKDAGIGLDGGTLEAKYGADWKKVTKARVEKKSGGFVCVIDLMAHCIREGNKLFANTPYADTW